MCTTANDTVMEVEVVAADNVEPAKEADPLDLLKPLDDYVPNEELDYTEIDDDVLLDEPAKSENVPPAVSQVPAETPASAEKSTEKKKKTNKKKKADTPLVSISAAVVNRFLVKLLRIERRRKMADEIARTRDQQFFKATEKLARDLSKVDERLGRVSKRAKEHEAGRIADYGRLVDKLGDVSEDLRKLKKDTTRSIDKVRDLLDKNPSDVADVVVHRMEATMSAARPVVGPIVQIESSDPPKTVKEKKEKPLVQCLFCPDSHAQLHLCTAVGTKAARLAELERKNICSNCIKKGHGAAACPRSDKICSACRSAGHHWAVCELNCVSESGENPRKRNSNPNPKMRKNRALALAAAAGSSNITEIGTNKKWLEKGKPAAAAEKSAKPDNDAAAKAKPKK